MSIAGLTLVLLAAVCHATWNVFVKRINGGAELIWMFSVISVLIYLPLAIWIIVVQRPVFGPWQIGFMLGTVALHLGYFLLLQTGYRKDDLSLVYPTARATGPLLSTTFAVLVLGEIVTFQMALGAGIIIFAVLMLTGGFKMGVRNLSASLMFGVGAGMFIASYTVWDAYAVSVLLVPPLLMDYASNLGRVVVLAPVAHRRRALMWQHWAHHRTGVIVIAMFSPLAYILVLYALTFTPVAYVAPAREVSVILTVLAGSILLREGDLYERLGWASIALVGMILLVLG
ncbi:EamA family transporter [Sulfitobacter sp. JBTF-M27]|uniref:EamA family transporter n=2 Tax=Sulfitobacter sediminilitoris TaxID=2698830 RepID=A0A6P0C9F3_9RHOB|nr:DMT family transporter [Sulfitobacter sediminilitoris]NEK21726.1 EamA family transporter [Sulfitobacter sediminilitoris]